MTRQWSIRAAVAACTAVGLLSGPVVASADPYVGLGDSYTAGPNTYANSLYSTYQSTLGAKEVVNLASPGATSSSILSSQVPLAETQINDADDTKAVTVLAGGNDILGGGPCSTAPDGPGCNLRANLAAIFDRIAAALVADPATFIVGLYPNPSSGTGSALEAQRNLQALGQNLTLDANDTGANAGLNDIILKEASDAGAIVVNPYPDFKRCGQVFISGDGLHPNAAGHAALANVFRGEPVNCPSSSSPTPQPDPQIELLTKADGTLTIDANKGRVEMGRKVLLSGQLDVASNESCEQNHQIQIQRRLKSEDDSKFATFATANTDATGNYSLKVKAKKTYFYRAVVAETDACDDETSNSQKVRVQKKKAAQEA
jgi:lysophospholipase L1-like esterase